MTREQSLQALESVAKENNMPGQMYQDIRQRYENGEMDNKWPDVIKFMIDMMASTTVCLPLTETCDNLLMWAHYAQNHEGFVIGFDKKHSFITGVGQGIYKLTKIKYANDRPSVGISKLSLIDTYFTKSNEWAYEKEWRVFEKIENADQVVDDSPYPIYLFKVPPDSIHEVIFGCRFDEVKRDSIIDLINSDDSLSHITFKQCVINDNYYRLQLENIKS